MKDVHFYCDRKELEVVADFTFLGAVLDSCGKVNLEISNRIGKVNIVSYQICNTVVGKREVGRNVKLHIFKSVHLPILLYGKERWILTDRQKSRGTAIEMKFLHRIVRKTGRDCIQNNRIREELEVAPVMDVVETCQLK